MTWRPIVRRWGLALILFAVFYFSLDALELLVTRSFRPTRAPEFERLKAEFHVRVLAVTAVLCGLFRVVSFHPRYRAAYAQWLRSTPWNARLPLPLGPVTLSWRDVPVLGAIAALAYLDMGGNGLAIFGCAFACAYTAATIIPLLTTGALVEAYWIVMGGAVLVGLWLMLLPMLATAGALLVIAHVGLWRSLHKFPWEHAARKEPSAEAWPLTRRRS